MELVLVAALTRSYVIGTNGRLPWHYPSDMRHFRDTTMGHAVIMGRVTFEGMPRRPLSGRTNLVLSRRAQLCLPTGTMQFAHPVLAHVLR